MQIWQEMMTNGDGDLWFIEYMMLRQTESYLRLLLECTSASFCLGTLWQKIHTLATFLMIMESTAFISQGSGTTYALLGHQEENQKLFW